jgi:hypothetical protein
MEATMQDLESKERRADMPEPVPKAGHRNSARRSYRRQIRASVRTQLSNSRLRRHELSQVLGVMRQDLFEFRTWLRTRLRVSSTEASWRKSSSPPAVAAPRKSQDANAPSKGAGAGHVPAS